MRFRPLPRLVSLWLGLAMFAGATQLHAADLVRIGALAFQSKADTLAQWEPTARYLEQSLPEHRFEVLPMHYDELNAALKEGQIDFVLTNPEHYVVLRNVYHLSPMATLNTLVEGSVFNSFGSVIFTRRDTGIQALTEVRGKRVAAVGLYSLGGFLIAADTFRQHHIKLQSSDVGQLQFTGLPHLQVVQQVMSGQADVGIVRTGVLERLAQRGELNFAEVRVLNARPTADFPQALSTDLYPEWPWAARAETDPALVKSVALALLNLKPNTTAAVTGRYHGFSPPANYAPVEDLMRRLKVYPGVAPTPLWEELWEEHKLQIQTAGLALLVLGLGLSVYLWRSNRKLRDMTRLYDQAQAGLRVAAVAFNSQVGLIVTDEFTRVVRANQAFCDMLGYSEHELLGKSTAHFRGTGAPEGSLEQVWASLQAQGRWQGELWCRHRHGHDLPCMVTITAILGDAIGMPGYIGSFVDVSVQKKVESEIRQLAFFDPLTELPNRRLFLERLQEVMSNCLLSNSLGALLFIDLDHFKILNDTHGHTVGDHLLQLIARRLSLIIGEDAMAARLGGDEFVVMLYKLNANTTKALGQALAVAETLREAILSPYQLQTEFHADSRSGPDPAVLRYSCSGSIGVALFGMREERVTEVLKRADVAMYQAKQAGRNAIRQFDPAAQQGLNESLALSVDLSTALAEGQLLLYYQLQVDTQGQAKGAECLLRWRHPERGMVSPAEFVALAEESGAIIAIGAWVLRTACETLADWACLPSLSGLSLSVNVSPRQFIESDFVPGLTKILQQTGARPERLILEITEGIVLKNTDQVIEKMQALCAMGIGFSIDDFGTGYSSLSYLQKLPLQEVKIDKAFVQDLPQSTSSEAIVRAIIALGDSMQLSVVSEGVETEDQKARLLAMGCSLLQGYLIAKPMVRDAFERLVKQLAEASAPFEPAQDEAPAH